MRDAPVPFRLDAASGVPFYRQIIDQVLGAIASGTLQGGDQLPTVRQLAVDLSINPNTVVHAYAELARARTTSGLRDLLTVPNEGIAYQVGVDRLVRLHLVQHVGQAQQIDEGIGNFLLDLNQLESALRAIAATCLLLIVFQAALWLVVPFLLALVALGGNLAWKGLSTAMGW